MAAQETFEWFVSTMVKHPDNDDIRSIKDARECLFTLRSEDERVRYVDTFIESFKKRRHLSR